MVRANPCSKATGGRLRQGCKEQCNGRTRPELQQCLSQERCHSHVGVLARWPIRTLAFVPGPTRDADAVNLHCLPSFQPEPWPSRHQAHAPKDQNQGKKGQSWQPHLLTSNVDPRRVKAALSHCMTWWRLGRQFSAALLLEEKMARNLLRVSSITSGAF